MAHEFSLPEFLYFNLRFEKTAELMVLYTCLILIHNILA